MTPQIGLCLAAALLVGCSATTTTETTASWQGGSKGVEGATSGTEGERWFPLKEGTLYHYKVEKIGSGPVAGGMLMMKVHRTSSTRGELRKPAGTQTFEFTSGGIATTSKAGAPAFLLKLPLQPGATWVGPHGGITRVERTDQALDVPAGKFNGCLVTVEERGGDSPMRVLTTLCPDVGIVRLEAQAGEQVERADLVYFGPAVDIGPEGLQRVP